MFVGEALGLLISSGSNIVDYFSPTIDNPREDYAADFYNGSWGNASGLNDLVYKDDIRISLI